MGIELKIWLCECGCGNSGESCYKCGKIQTKWNVVDYCREEVERQGHNTLTLDGIERVGWMLNAWSYAIQESNRLPTIEDIDRIGSMIERIKNDEGFRKCEVRVGYRICPPASEVEGRLDRLFENFPFEECKTSTIACLNFYRELLEIHPFEDGNGRTGKIVLNWLNDSLLNPIFPPFNFWGKEIKNP